MLRHDGFDIFVATTGHEAIDIAAREDVAIVLADYNMPSPNGIELLDLLRAQRSGIVGLMTGELDVERKVGHALESTHTLFLQKAVDACAGPGGAQRRGGHQTSDARLTETIESWDPGPHRRRDRRRDGRGRLNARQMMKLPSVETLRLIFEQHGCECSEQDAVSGCRLLRVRRALLDGSVRLVVVQLSSGLTDAYVRSVCVALDLDPLVVLNVFG